MHKTGIQYDLSSIPERNLFKKLSIRINITTIDQSSERTSRETGKSTMRAASSIISSPNRGYLTPRMFIITDHFHIYENKGSLEKFFHFHENERSNIKG